MANRVFPLTDDQKRAVIKYHLAHPHVKAIDICRKYGISVNQFQFALKKHREGKLTKGTRRPRPKKIHELLKESDSDALLNGQLDYAIAQMASNNDLDVGNRIDMLHKLVSTRHTQQRITLQGHLRKVDSEIFSALVRLFLPNATDDEIISYYQRAVEITRQVSK